jgi:L-malate glycosyltransferase
MKIAYPIIRGSGVEVYHQRLSAGLSKLGFETRVIRFSPHFEFFPWALAWTFQKLKSPKFIVDLIHTHAEYGCFLRKKGKPLVVTLHHSSIDQDYLASLSPALKVHHQLILKPSVNKTMHLADRLVAVSSSTKAMLCDVFQRDFPIKVIYNGIDAEVFRPLREEKPSANGPVLLFFSGNLTRRKGIDLIGPVMKQLGGDFLLHYTTGLRRAASGPLRAPNIRCLGFLEERELVREINRADIAFQPSRREGFGYSILEAMACGRPIVSSNCSAIPEIVEHGKGGYLCEVGSVAQMVAAIRNLAQSLELRRRMGEYNRQVVLQRFTLQAMCNQYCTLYRGLMA